MCIYLGNVGRKMNEQLQKAYEAFQSSFHGLGMDRDNVAVRSRSHIPQGQVSRVRGEQEYDADEVLKKSPY